MRQNVRAREEIMADVGKLLASPDLKIDRYAGKKFRGLYFAQVFACGIGVREAQCKRCGHIFDHTSVEESSWAFALEGNVVVVVYICPECGEKTPQDLAIPEGNLTLN